MKSNLPQSVIVAGIQYKVAIKTNDQMPAEDEGHTLLGECGYFDNYIHVNEIACDERKEQVFIHELTHAIFFEAGFEEQDEDMINRVGKVLYQVLKDNPHLLTLKEDATCAE